MNPLNESRIVQIPVENPEVSLCAQVDAIEKDPSIHTVGIDVSLTRMVNSVLLGQMAKAIALLRQRGGRVCIYAPHSLTTDLLVASGLNRIAGLFSDHDLFMEACKAPPATGASDVAPPPPDAVPGPAAPGSLSAFLAYLTASAPLRRVIAFTPWALACIAVVLGIVAVAAFQEVGRVNQEAGRVNQEKALAMARCRQVVDSLAKVIAMRDEEITLMRELDKDGSKEPAHAERKP